jgi:hypothetical protein
MSLVGTALGAVLALTIVMLAVRRLVILPRTVPALALVPVASRAWPCSSACRACAGARPGSWRSTSTADPPPGREVLSSTWWMGGETLDPGMTVPAPTTPAGTR